MRRNCHLPAWVRDDWPASALRWIPGVASSLSYRSRCPEQGALHQIVREHYETFRAQVAEHRDGQGLPRFVERAFQDFLTCGCLAAGFARFRCAGCRHERFVAFSCKGRGFCPSCGGRRMTERAAHLVDHVFPVVPVRQWVLTLPSRVRYALAWDHALCRAVVAVFVRAVLGWYRRHARLRGIDDGQRRRRRDCAARRLCAQSERAPPCDGS